MHSDTEGFYSTRMRRGVVVLPSVLWKRTQGQWDKIHSWLTCVTVNCPSGGSHPPTPASCLGSVMPCYANESSVVCNYQCTTPITFHTQTFIISHFPVISQIPFQLCLLVYFISLSTYNIGNRHILF